MKRNFRPFVVALEDDLDDQVLIKSALENRCDVQFASRLDEFEAIVKAKSPDLVLLDVSLNGASGFDLLKSIRGIAAIGHVPIFFLTGNRGREERIKGLSLGADDYIVKPFDSEELWLRVLNRIKCAMIHAGGVLKSGRLALNLASQKVFINTGPGIITPDLTPTEYKILLFFMKNVGVVLDRETIINGVWSDKVHVLERTVDTHVKHLRRKLLSEGKRLESVRANGFRLAHPSL